MSKNPDCKSIIINISEILDYCQVHQTAKFWPMRWDVEAIHFNEPDEKKDTKFGHRSGGGRLFPILIFDRICFAKKSESQ